MLKRILAVAVVGCLTAVIATGQQRVLVSSNGEVIPLRPGESVEKVLLKHHLTDVSKVQSVLACPTTLTVGNNSGNVGGFTFNDGDTWLGRFVAPFSGQLIQVYFRANQSTSQPGDTTGTLRIFKSNIQPSDVGVGATTWLGFYRSPTDPEGNTPFKTDTPDTTFVAGTAGAKDPNGDEMWSFGGFTVPWPQAAVNVQVVLDTSLNDYPGALSLTKGDVFNVNLRVPPQTPETTPKHAEYAQIAENNTNAVGSFWKYYYRSRGVTPGDTGWYSRHDYNMRMWVVLEATGDLPPQIVDYTVLGNTLSTSALTVTADGYDCNAANPADTGVASAALNYSTDGGTTWTAITMTSSSGVWSGDIPGFSFPTVVKYYVSMTDIHSNTSNSGTVTYQCLSLTVNNYTISMPAYNWVDVTTTGTQIPLTDFHDNKNSTTPYAQNDDDGTAGPFDLGGSFSLFGVPLRYCFVGANGGVTLSDSVQDTIYASQNSGTGVFYAPYRIPYTPTSVDPINFIPIFWNDLALSGVSGGGNGFVYTGTSGTQFIVEYVGVGNFVDTVTSSFEVILDRADNSVLMQYNTIDPALVASGLTGLEVDGVNKFIEANYQGTPAQTAPANGFALKFTPGPSSVNEPAGKPRVFALNQNYPNPFNPSTKISYSIPTASNVDLSIYNVLGQKVATLVDGYKAPGDYTVDFAPTRLASGVYFYSLKAGQYSSVKKMVLMK